MIVSLALFDGCEAVIVVSDSQFTFDVLNVFACCDITASNIESIVSAIANDEIDRETFSIVERGNFDNVADANACFARVVSERIASNADCFAA